MTVTASNGDSVTIPQTPANVKQVNDLVREIKAGNFDPTLPDKLGKACSSALAHNNMLRINNEDLIKADQRKKDKASRGQAHYGEAQVMNLETVQKRNEAFATKQLDKEFKIMCRLGSDIFQDSKRGRSPVKKKTTIPLTPGPSTPGPLIPVWLAPPQILPSASPERPRDGKTSQRGGKTSQQAVPPEAPPQQQQRCGKTSQQVSKRGGRRVERGNGRGSERGSERGNAIVIQEVVEEAPKEVRKSRVERTLKPKTR